MDVDARVTGIARISSAARSQAISTADAIVDCAFLGVVTAVSLALYVGHLGFYYDDYSVLARMAASHDRSLFGLYHSVRPATGQRPLQALTFATLYRLFGLHPLGYHFVNACLLIAIAALLYLTLRELRLPRLICIALPLVYSTLPHYSTDRFWLDAFQVNLSSAFYLGSLYAALRALRSSAPALVLWVSLAVLGVAGSLFAYELVFPLFVLNVGLIWWAGHRLPHDVGNRRAARIVMGVLASAIIVVGAAKLAFVAEKGQNGYQIGFQSGLLHHLAYLVAGSIKLNLGTYFFAFPYVIWWIFEHRLSAATVAIAGITGLLAFVYLWRIARLERDPFERSGIWRGLARVGGLAFVLGYAIFLTNQEILFRSAGIDNRVNAGAALGVAALLIAAIGWCATRLQARRSALAFSAAIACTVAAGVFVIDTLGSFWTAAAHQQRSIVSGIRKEALAIAPSSTVILDGSCPEIGPAVVFADQWDLRGALQLAYHDPSLKADVAAERMSATRDGLAVDMTFLDQVFRRTYPYGRTLMVYDDRNGRLYRLADRRQALTYLARSRPSFRCPPQRSFAWGFNPSRRRSLL